LSESEPDAESYGFRESEARALLDAGSLHTIAAESLLWTEGRGVDSCVLVVAGEFEISRTLAGKPCRLGTAGPGHLLALMAVLDACPCPIVIRATTASSVVEINRNALVAMLDPSGPTPGFDVTYKLALFAIRRLRNATCDLAHALHVAVAAPGRAGRIDPLQVARIQAANHVWMLA